MNALRNDQISPILSLQLRYFDLNTRDEQGTPPLLIALANDSYKVADYLVQQPGLDLDATNTNDENALMLAALKGQLQLAQALLKRGAQVNKPGWTPLHYAAASAAPASEQVAKLLLDNFAYIDAASPNQTTPLMMAARYGSGKVVELLLNEGADPTLKNDKGMAALDFARSVSRQDLVELISQHMARSRTAVAPGATTVQTGSQAVPASVLAPETETMPIAEPAVQAFPLDGTESSLPAAAPEQLVAPKVESVLPAPSANARAESVQVPPSAPVDVVPVAPASRPEDSTEPMTGVAPGAW